MEWTELLSGEKALLAGQLAAAFFTAVATVALAIFTWVLARATSRLSNATSQPLVTATLEPNQWSLRHFDLVLENSGNAPAFDVRVTLSPDLPEDKISKDRAADWVDVSVLRPSQILVAYACESAQIMDLEFSVSVSWKRRPSARKREDISYRLDLRKYKQKSRLGASSPLHQIAEEIKRSRDDWRMVAQGQRRLRVDVFSESDRQEDRRQAQDAYEAAMDRRRSLEADGGGDENRSGGGDA